jgi:hypothetical protein
MRSMPRSKKTITEQIAEAEQDRKEAAARLTKLRGIEQKANRKRENHRKMIIGGGLMTHAQHDPEFDKVFRVALHKAITRKIDREAIADLLTDELTEPNQGK